MKINVSNKLCYGIRTTARNFLGLKSCKKKRKEKMTSIQQKILKLTQFWCKYICFNQSCRHDVYGTSSCDCFWEIICRWAYGNKPVWIVFYGFGDGKIICDSYEEAEKVLLKLLQQMINEERIEAKEVIAKQEGDEIKIEKAKMVLAFDAIS